MQLGVFPRPTRQLAGHRGGVREYLAILSVGTQERLGAACMPQAISAPGAARDFHSRDFGGDCWSGAGREWRPSHSLTRRKDCLISALVMCSNAASRHSKASDWPFDCAISHQVKAIT